MGGVSDGLFPLVRHGAEVKALASAKIHSGAAEKATLALETSGKEAKFRFDPQMKCCKYWPDDTELYGDIKITLLKTETLSDYTVRTFSMERVSGARPRRDL